MSRKEQKKETTKKESADYESEVKCCKFIKYIDKETEIEIIKDINL
jgi:hypothetical protein